jgi:hypothetical protein
MKEGWIKLHRRLTEKGYYKDSEYVHLWIHLLCNASHKTTEFLFNNKVQKLEVGQLLTGRLQLAKDTGISESKVERILKCFESEQQIEQQKNNRFRLITIKNWTAFQQSEQQIEQPVNNQWTASEQPVDTYKNVKELKECKEGEGRQNNWPTPSQQAKEFFLSVQEKNSSYNEMVEKISKSRNLTFEQVSAEFDKFANYWTELAADGKKQRWEKEKFFETQRRLSTWFRNVNKFGASPTKNFRDKSQSILIIPSSKKQ